MAERPGIMCYYTEWEPIINMGDELLAKFFRAAVQYAHYGVIPDFSGVESVLWQMIASKLDRDAENYKESCRTKAYNRYRGVEKSHGREPLEREEWEESQRELTDVNKHDQPQPSGNYNGTVIVTERQREKQGDQRGEKREISPCTDERVFQTVPPETRDQRAKRAGVSW